MIVLIQANIMAVGLGSRTEVLEKLPVRVITMPTGLCAARALKSERIDSVISSWELEDMKDGQFIRSLNLVKPDIPTIVFVKANQPQQEVQARSFGATAVLTEDASDEMFTRTVANILGLTNLVSIQSVSNAEIKANDTAAPLVMKSKQRARMAN